MSGRHRGAVAVAAMLAMAAGGCAQLEGDFGRPRPSVIRDEALPIVGGAFASLRGEPVSLFAMTDDERQLRDLAYAFLTPPEGFKALSLPVGELRAARIMANRPVEPAPGVYTVALLSYQYRSTTARWQRLIDDIRSDSDRIGPVVRIAARVAEMDRVRQQSFKHIQSLGETERDQAIARIDENKKLIGDVRAALAERIEIYRHAMEHLLVAQPAPVAIEAERALKGLQDKAANPVLALASRPLALPAQSYPGYFPGRAEPGVVRKD